MAVAGALAGGVGGTSCACRALRVYSLQLWFREPGPAGVGHAQAVLDRSLNGRLASWHDGAIYFPRTGDLPVEGPAKGDDPAVCAVGGGGLGQLAINYGYQQFNVGVMLITVVLLIVVVQLIQMIGDYCARHRAIKPIAWVSGALWLACLSSQVWGHVTLSQGKELTVGSVS